MFTDAVLPLERHRVLAVKQALLALKHTRRFAVSRPHQPVSVATRTSWVIELCSRLGVPLALERGRSSGELGDRNGGNRVVGHALFFHIAQRGQSRYLGYPSKKVIGIRGLRAPPPR